MHIHEFQEMMRLLYFHRDSERGIVGTYEWLADELKELGEALNAKGRQGVGEEFADVIAWLASFANVAGVNLETATLKKYHGKCPKCERSPCACTF